MANQTWPFTCLRPEITVLEAYCKNSRSWVFFTKLVKFLSQFVTFFYCGAAARRGEEGRLQLLTDAHARAPPPRPRVPGQYSCAGSACPCHGARRGGGASHSPRARMPDTPRRHGRGSGSPPPVVRAPVGPAALASFCPFVPLLGDLPEG